MWADQLVSDPALDQFMDAALGAQTSEDRAAKMREALQLAYDQAYFIPLYRYVDSYALNPRVINWEAPNDELVVVGVNTDIED